MPKASTRTTKKARTSRMSVLSASASVTKSPTTAHNLDLTPNGQSVTRDKRFDQLTSASSYALLENLGCAWADEVGIVAREITNVVKVKDVRLSDKGVLIRGKGAATKDMRFDDEVPRTVVDRSGVALVAYYPNFLLSETVQRCTDDLIRFASSNKPKIGKGGDANGRGAPETYKHVNGQVAGQIKLIKASHAIGHTKEPPAPSQDIRSSYTPTLGLLRRLAIVSHPINSALKKLDPQQYQQLQQLNSVLEGSSDMEDLNKADPLLLTGRVVLFNRQTPLHRDVRDPELGWAFLVALGSFEGGDIRLPSLRLTMRMQPGDAIALRGHALEHEVLSWTGGQRISLAHFSHKSIWVYCGLSLPKPEPLI